MKVKHVFLIAAVLLALLVTPVMADESMDVSVNANPEYSITIPESFTFSAATAGTTKDGAVSVAITLINPNSYVSVSVKTENLWYLNHVSGSGDQIRYEMSVDGNPVANNGVVIANDTSETKNVIFTLKESAKKAGSYKDTLTFTAEMITVVEVSDATKLNDVLTGLTDAGSGNTAISITENLDLTGVTWNPVVVEGYTGAGVITINGNGKTITGLSAPLFAGGFAGGSGIVINDLTIANSEIVSTNTIGSGAFIESIDSMQTITLNNCHLKDSKVTGGTGSRTGGLIGWTAGYNNVNDGPVKTYVTITGCSVINNTITCDGSVGGINGHAGNNAWTYTTIKDCTVTDNILTSTDDGGWRVGVVVGTANVGEVIISDITESRNTLTQTGKTAPEGQSNLYGRFVPSGTGKLTIDEVEISA